MMQILLFADISKGLHVCLSVFSCVQRKVFSDCIPVNYTGKNTSAYTDTCCSKNIHRHMGVHPAVYLVLKVLVPLMT